MKQVRIVKFERGYNVDVCNVRDEYSTIEGRSKMAAVSTLAEVLEIVEAELAEVPVAAEVPS